MPWPSWKSVGRCALDDLMRKLWCKAPKEVDTEHPPQQLPWSVIQPTGLDAVDQQHRRLVEIFNEAVLALSRGAPRVQTGVLLNSLFNYTHYHFQEESQWMRRYGVSTDHQRVHLQAHGRFIHFLKQSRAIAERYPEEFVGDVLTFLAQWLVTHINVVDRQMGEEIRRQQEHPGGPNQGGDGQMQIEALSQLSDTLGRSTFDILEQKRQLLNLQGLYCALLESASAMINSHDEKKMLQNLCDALMSQTSFHVVWVGQPGAGPEFGVLAIAGSGVEQVRDAPPSLDSEGGSSIVVRAWNTRQVVVCNDALKDAGLRPWHSGFRRNGWKSLLAAPIFRGGNIWATLALISSVTNAFDGDTVALCTRVVELLGHGLDELDLRGRLVRQEAREAHRARHDVLTDLPNRLALLQELPQAVARAKRHGTYLAVGMIDLDDFKPVNDTLGHAAGDELLRQFASRLQSLLRASDVLVRFGGDEFVVVFEDLDPETVMVQLRGALERLHYAVETPFGLGGDRSVSIQMSLGVAIFPDHGGDADTLLRLADQALYTAKAKKTNRGEFWALFGEELSHTRAASAQHLLGIGALEVWYQPILDYKRHRIVGVEALARLRDSDGQLLNPAQFLPALEPRDLSVLSKKVLEHVLVDLGELEVLGQPLWASVNVDPRSISESCVFWIQDQIAAAGIDPNRITLEILGGSDFSDQIEALDHLQGFKNLRVRLALDKVGSAYASLLRIKQVPIDDIKLDQGFTRTLEEHPEELIFVRAMRELAQDLGVDLIVQGAETDDILDALAVLGVRLMQGYGIAEPLPLEALKAFLAQPLAQREPGPRSLLGLYAEHLMLHDTLKKTILDARGSLGYLPIADHEHCALHRHLQRLKPTNLDRLETLHAEYHRQLATVVTSSLEDWTQVEELSKSIKEEIVSAYHALRSNDHGLRTKGTMAG